MTRRVSLLWAIVAAGAVVPISAHAQCEFDGSVPGTAAKTTIVSAGGQTIYVDDRDYADADDDGVAGGLWLYYESNHVVGLQRGGSSTIGLVPDPCIDSATPDLALLGLYGTPDVAPNAEEIVKTIDALLRGLQQALQDGVTVDVLPGKRCEFDGSVPGTAAKTYVVGSGGQTIYVDDRDYADADEDGVAGGIWIYLESNRVGGLQRGGSQFLLAVLPGSVPYLPPVDLVPPDPRRPVLKGGVLLFPDGFGGGSVAGALGETDPCVESATPDTVLFGGAAPAIP